MSDPFGYGGGYLPNYQQQTQAMLGTPSTAQPYDPVSQGPDMGGMIASKGFKLPGLPKLPSWDNLPNPSVPSYPGMPGIGDFFDGSRPPSARRPPATPPPNPYGYRVQDDFSADPYTFGGRSTPLTLNVKSAEAKEVSGDPVGGATNPIHSLRNIGSTLNVSDPRTFMQATKKFGAEDLYNDLRTQEADRMRYNKLSLGGIQDAYMNAAAQMRGIYADPRYSGRVQFEGGEDAQLNYLQAAYNQVLKNMAGYGYL